MEIIDTHQHLWDLERFSYSWTAGEPRLNRSFRMEDYLAATAGVGVVQSVHVEADIDERFMIDETKYLFELADRPDNPLAGVVAAARPESDEFGAHLAMIAGHPALKGIRRLLQSAPDELPTTTTFISNIRSLEAYGLSFDICAQARQLPYAIHLVRECPGVEFILDHCGNPEIRTGVSDLWRDSIAEIASLPNVVCKISGIVVNADREHWTSEDLRPSIEWVIACFGWDRVIFGSDWPVCTLASTLERWVRTLDELTAAAGEENRRKLFSGNARRVYKLSEKS